jgi:hypothetical protein
MDQTRAFAASARWRGLTGLFVLLILLSLSWSLAIAQGLPQRVTALEREVAALQSTVDTLTAEVATLGQPDSATVIFAYNRPVSFTTDPVSIGEGWTKMTFSVGVSYGGFLCDYALRVPAIPGVVSGELVEQLRVSCGCGVICPMISIPVISDFYEFSTGTSSGAVTAAGVVEK